MLTMGLSIIEHSDLLFEAAQFNKEKHHARCRFNKYEEDIVSHEEMLREQYNDYISACSQLTNKAD